MNLQFADRMKITQKSFIREILKVTEDPNIISFAGGLPNPKFFPVKEISDAATKVLKENGNSILQYSTTEGYFPLRKYISDRYLEKKGLVIDPEEIVILNGSQQGLDLVGKILLNKGDHIVIEKPGYLGAIQALTTYEPIFHSVPLLEDGIDLNLLEEVLKNNPIKLIYSVPNFQNPSGISYSKENREKLSELLKPYNTLVLEDDPYGELRFIGEDMPTIKEYLKDQGILLGSFSKIVAPGLRLGWICAPKEITEKIIIAKQASDLHSNCLSQRILYQYLCDTNIDEHIAIIREAYKKQRDLMVSMMACHFPKEVTFTKPEGGMFLWGTLPEGLSSNELFERCIKENVAFVPGSPFYVDGSGNNTFRLNFSNSDEVKIEEGIKRLAKAIKELF